MMIKLLTVIGARPQIIKAAALSRAIRNSFSDRLQEIILHTGQHYDRNMSQVFFDELEIPHPDFNLNVGSGAHGQQTALMIKGIEEHICKVKPQFIILYGDTNSTLAGAVAASKAGVDVVHIEAGLRSFNKRMPEEVNRIVCDHVSTLLFTPTIAGYQNLLREGFSDNNSQPFNIDNPGLFHCGDIMYDNSLYFTTLAEKKSDILKKHNLQPQEFVLVTIHRDLNTDNPIRLTAIFETLNKLAYSYKIDFILPLHPRTAKMINELLAKELIAQITKNRYIKIIQPVSFLEMIMLEKAARMIITDSGGVQKEAYFFKKPSIILRPETEWIEIVENKVGILANANPEKIENAFLNFMKSGNLDFPPLFGDGKAAEFICNLLIETYQFKIKSNS